MTEDEVAPPMLEVETEQDDEESYGVRRWAAELPSIPGAMAWGETESQARARALAVGLRAMAYRLWDGEAVETALIAGLMRTAAYELADE